MARNPALSEKRFEDVRDEWEPGWAAPGRDAAVAAEGTSPPPVVRTGVMTANGTFAKTFVLFLLVLAGGAVGWSQVSLGPSDQVEIPGWTWIFLLGAFAVAMVCIFKPKASPFLAPLYAVTEGVFLGALSKAFEVRWDGIVFQAVLATVGVFFATLALYVFGIVKVTKRFTMVVIGATFGILLLYIFAALLSLFGVDVVFWNQPTALGIIVSVAICIVASLNLFLDYEFIRQASVQGAPKYMEWYGGFGIMVTLVWIYIEMLRLLSLLRR
jgi:uncharacterized YccA/Bax inhibitor family protein